MSSSPPEFDPVVERSTRKYILLQSPPLRRLVLGKLGQLGPSRLHEFLVRVGMAGKPPSSLKRLGEKDPGHFGKGRVRSRTRYKASELAYDRELLLGDPSSGGHEGLPDVSLERYVRS